MTVRVAVLGLGSFGGYIAGALYREGCDVLGVDRHPECVQALKDAMTQTVAGDVRDREVLQTLGVHEMDIAVVAMGDSVATSILLVQYLAKAGVPQIVAKATNEEHAEALESVGATLVSIPERDVAERLARHIVRPNVIDFVPLEEGYSVIELIVPDSFIGKTIADLHIRKKYGVAVLAVQFNGADEDAKPTVISSPHADFAFQAGQRMVLYGADADLARIRDIT